jgi:hypothetical protein
VSRPVETTDEDQKPVQFKNLSAEDLAYLAQREGLPGRELPQDLKEKAGVDNIREVLEAEGRQTNGETPQMKLEHEDPPEDSNPNAASDEDERADVGPSDEDWYGDEDTTKNDLVNELSKRKLDVSGRKDDLIRRLRQDDAQVNA